jgi:hypothetical protein
MANDTALDMMTLFFPLLLFSDDGGTLFFMDQLPTTGKAHGFFLGGNRCG